jgi:hypothetical protein
VRINTITITREIRKEFIMKMTKRVMLMFAFLAAGFAVGLPVGQSIGFSTGSEWALVQADIVAREAGVYMPVNFADGAFRVVVKQRPHLYKRAWELADLREQDCAYDCQSTGSLKKSIRLARSAFPTQ